MFCFVIVAWDLSLGKEKAHRDCMTCVRRQQNQSGGNSPGPPDEEGSWRCRSPVDHT